LRQRGDGRGCQALREPAPDLGEPGLAVVEAQDITELPIREQPSTGRGVQALGAELPQHALGHPEEAATDEDGHAGGTAPILFGLGRCQGAQLEIVLAGRLREALSPERAGIAQRIVQAGPREALADPSHVVGRRLFG
jgi:hypothetical protein